MVSYKFTKKDFQSVLRKAEFFISALPDTKKVYRIEIKEHKEKRSLDANGYFWLLLDELAKATSVPKTELYRNAIKEIGGVSTTGCFKTEDVDDLCKMWNKKGLGWQTETTESKIDGCTNIIFYKGSSDFDTEQMARLIDNIVQDCKALDIPTETPDQIAKKLSLWGEAYEKHNAK